MTRSVSNALKAVAVLVAITVVCVGLLALCNRLFPKYVPTLDNDTAKLINAVCPTGETDAKAFDDGYIVMLYEDEYEVKLADFNKSHKSSRAEVLCVYGEVKGKNAGAYVIESKSTGRDSDIIILVAYKDGVIVGATVKKQGESYWSKLPDDIFGGVIGESGNVDLKGIVGKTGATISLSAIERALNLSSAFASDNDAKLRSVITEKSKASLAENKSTARCGL